MTLSCPAQSPGATDPSKLLNTPIRVGIADDHAITRYALGRHIQAHPHMVLVGEADSGTEAMHLVRRGGMDVLLLDLMMPGAGGLDVLHRIRARAPGLGVVVLSNYPPERYALNALRLGAHAYLAKHCEPAEIIRAITATAAGQRTLTAEITDLLATSLDSAAREPHESLTQTEFQILLHLAKGEKSGDVAKTLSLSPKTVSTYRTSLMKKMDTRTNSDLTRYALSRGLLD